MRKARTRTRLAIDEMYSEFVVVAYARNNSKIAASRPYRKKRDALDAARRFNAGDHAVQVDAVNTPQGQVFGWGLVAANGVAVMTSINRVKSRAHAVRTAERVAAGNHDIFDLERNLVS